MNAKVLVYHPQSQQITEWFSYLESAAQVETNVDLIGFPSQIQSLSLSLPVLPSCDGGTVDCQSK